MSTALITGATGGIGSAIALSLAKEGYNVVLHYNKNEKRAQELLHEIKKYSNAIAISADLSIPKSVNSLYNKATEYFGSIDTLICASGIAHYDSFENLNETTYDTVANINLKSQMLLIATALPSMRQKGYGRIVVISSIWGEVGGSYEVLYSVTKSALNGLCKSLSKEVASCGITINAVSPGVIQTQMLDKFTKQEQEDLIRDIPVGRFGTPEEVASLVKFLCSKEASYITGEVIGINGGFGK